MRLDEAEKEIFENLINKFAEEFGKDMLFAVFKLHRQLNNEISGNPSFKNFPISTICNYLIYTELQTGKYSDMTVHQISIEFQKRMGISKGRFYNFYHKYYLPRLKEESKSRKKLM